MPMLTASMTMLLGVILTETVYQILSIVMQTAMAFQISLKALVMLMAMVLRIIWTPIQIMMVSQTCLMAPSTMMVTA